MSNSCFYVTKRIRVLPDREVVILLAGKDQVRVILNEETEMDV